MGRILLFSIHYF